MYHAIVRRRIVKSFDLLTAGEWPALTRQLAEDVHHVFPGENPLGGERHTRAAVMRWFDRLGRLFPGHRFDVYRAAVRGWPWDTWVAVAWRAELQPQRGEPYTNTGAHWIHLRWGRATYFHAYLDTERVTRACRRMAELGVEEASSAPIVD